MSRLDPEVDLIQIEVVVALTYVRGAFIRFVPHTVIPPLFVAVHRFLEPIDLGTGAFWI